MNIRSSLLATLLTVSVCLGVPRVTTGDVARANIGGFDESGKEGGTAGVRMEHDIVRAITHYDVPFLERSIADDYTFIDDRGKLVTKSKFLEDIKYGETKLESIEIEDVRGRSYGETVVVTGVSRQKGLAHGRDISGYYRFTRVYARAGGRLTRPDTPIVLQAVAFQVTRIQE